MLNFKDKVIELIKNQVEDLSEEDISRSIEIPPSYDMGDYAFPAFRLSKIFRKAPNMIAEELVEARY